MSQLSASVSSGTLSASQDRPLEASDVRAVLKEISSGQVSRANRSAITALEKLGLLETRAEIRQERVPENPRLKEDIRIAIDQLEDRKQQLEAEKGDIERNCEVLTERRQKRLHRWFAAKETLDAEDGQIRAHKEGAGYLARCVEALNTAKDVLAKRAAEPEPMPADDDTKGFIRFGDKYARLTEVGTRTLRALDNEAILKQTLIKQLSALTVRTEQSGLDQAARAELAELNPRIAELKRFDLCRLILGWTPPLTTGLVRSVETPRDQAPTAGNPDVESPEASSLAGQQTAEMAEASFDDSGLVEVVQGSLDSDEPAAASRLLGQLAARMTPENALRLLKAVGDALIEAEEPEAVPGLVEKVAKVQTLSADVVKGLAEAAYDSADDTGPSDDILRAAVKGLTPDEFQACCAALAEKSWRDDDGGFDSAKDFLLEFKELLGQGISPVMSTLLDNNEEDDDWEASADMIRELSKELQCTELEGVLAEQALRVAKELTERGCVTKADQFFDVVKQYLPDDWNSKILVQFITGILKSNEKLTDYNVLEDNAELIGEVEAKAIVDVAKDENSASVEELESVVELLKDKLAQSDFAAGAEKAVEVRVENGELDEAESFIDNIASSRHKESLGNAAKKLAVAIAGNDVDNAVTFIEKARADWEIPFSAAALAVCDETQSYEDQAKVLKQFAGWMCTEDVNRLAKETVPELLKDGCDEADSLWKEVSCRVTPALSRELAVSIALAKLADPDSDDTEATTTWMEEQREFLAEWDDFGKFVVEVIEGAHKDTENELDEAAQAVLKEFKSDIPAEKRAELARLLLFGE